MVTHNDVVTLWETIGNMPIPSSLIAQFRHDVESAGGYLSYGEALDSLREESQDLCLKHFTRDPLKAAKAWEPKYLLYRVKDAARRVRRKLRKQRPEPRPFEGETVEEARDRLLHHRCKGSGSRSRLYDVLDFVQDRQDKGDLCPLVAYLHAWKYTYTELSEAFHVSEATIGRRIKKGMQQIRRMDSQGGARGDV